jgi:hypothetical protein
MRSKVMESRCSITVNELREREVAVCVDVITNKRSAMV